jgi:hypothetical protein
MSELELNIEIIDKIMLEMGNKPFKEALNELNSRRLKRMRETCDHNWELLQVVGDGSICSKCGDWKPEDA